MILVRLLRCIVSNITLLLSSMLGSRGGSTPTYTISGTVSGDTDADVTITLTGDASDSTTTAGDGTYSFTGLLAGSYTVTPSKSGYQFTPASTNITLSADDTGNDFTAAAEYTISGTVSGDVASGVTITLTGDASDSTTTAGDGTYSFTGLLNGSYTVTPSLAGYDFSPASGNVTVSGADNTGNDFASSSVLTTPWLYDISDVSQTSGNVGGVVPGWTLFTGYNQALVVNSVPADTNSYTPSGATKTFRANNTTVRVMYDLPHPISNTITKFRVAMLVKNNATHGSSFFLFNKTAAEVIAGTPAVTGTLGHITAPELSPDQISSFENYDSETQRNAYANTSLGSNLDLTRWHWVRWEYDFVAGTIGFDFIRDEDDAVIFHADGVGAMHADGIALGRVPSDLKTLMWMTHSYSGYDIYVTKFWIGTGADDWPT